MPPKKARGSGKGGALKISELPAHTHTHVMACIASRHTLSPPVEVT